MKNILILLICSFFCINTQAVHAGDLSNFDRTSISVTESDIKYEIKAEFNPDKTGKVRQCLNEYLKGNNDASFKNAEIDATMTLSNHTTFYIKSAPGELHIKFEKNKNSTEALAKLKKLCAELKKAVDGK